MAPTRTPKRKRSSCTNARSASKRPKYAESSSSPSSQSQSQNLDGFWAAEGILQEDNEAGKYLIAWKGADPNTCKPYEPTWEPKSNANASLVIDWETEKAKRARAKKRSSDHEEGEEEEEELISGKESPRASSPGLVRLKVGNTGASPAVLVKKKENLDHSEYDYFSQIALDTSPVRNSPLVQSSAPSQPSNEHQPSLQRASPSQSLPYFRRSPSARSSSSLSSPPSHANSNSDFEGSPIRATDFHGFRTSGIVPDSQPSQGSANFLPSTSSSADFTSTGTEAAQSSAGATLSSAEDIEEATEAEGSIAGQGERDGTVHREVEFEVPESQPVIVEDFLDQHWERYSAERNSVDTSSGATGAESQQEFQEAQKEADIIVIDTSTGPSASTLETQNSESGAVKDRLDLEQVDQVVVHDPLDTSTDHSQSVQAPSSGPYKAQAESLKSAEGATGRSTDSSSSTPTSHDIENSGHSAPSTSQSGTPKEQISGSQPAYLAVRQESVPLDELLQTQSHQTSSGTQDSIVDPTSSARSIEIFTAAQPEKTVSGDVEQAAQVPQSSFGENIARRDFAEFPRVDNSQSPDIRHRNHHSSQSENCGTPRVLDTQSAQQTYLSFDTLQNQQSSGAYILKHETDTTGSAQFPASPQPETSQSQSNPSRTAQEQNAQVVLVDLYFSTQDDSLGSIRPTVEVVRSQTRQEDSAHSPASSISRTSLSVSQTPPPSVRDSSSPARVPSNSLGSVDSNEPSRPKTPTSHSLSQGRTHIRTTPRYSPHSQSSIGLTGPAQTSFRMSDNQGSGAGGSESAPLFSTRSTLTPYKKFIDNESPAGTRSPSTIPDRSPLPSQPTSLRTIALPKAVEGPAPEPEPEPLLPPPSIPALSEPIAASTSVPVSPTVVPPEPELGDVDTAIEDPSDTETEVEASQMSLLNDDLHLLQDEFIVPLPMDGRQRSMYIHELDKMEDTLRSFLDEPQDFEKLDNVQRALQTLKGIETHTDLIYGESDSNPTLTSPGTQARWDMENCVKFRFLGALLDSLQHRAMNMFIVLEKDDDKLVNILIKFCTGKCIDYSYPAKIRKADPITTEGRVHVTILAKDSNPIVQPPDAIVCLDGPTSATEVRKNKWAFNPDRPEVPVIELVIPRAISHIERYVSPSLTLKQRLHTIFASLGQLYERSEIGRPMTDCPSAVVAAEMVAEFLTSESMRDAEENGWPLPSIGSIKGMIEYQTQQTQEHVVAKSPSVNPSKRPLDVEDLDPSKRMRMTPQMEDPSAGPSTQIPPISNSMPPASLYSTDIKTLRAALKACEQRNHEYEIAFEARQSEFEAAREETLSLRREHKGLIEAKEAAERQKEALNERFHKRTDEIKLLREELLAQQQANLASTDEKVVEITRLRKELELGKQELDKAQKNVVSMRDTNEYVTTMYRKAQDAATSASTRVATLEAQVSDLQTQAAASIAENKKLHIASQTSEVLKQNAALQTKIRHLEKVLQQKEEEISRMRNAKGVGMGTRAQSVPRSPRVGPGAGPGSRGASPMGGGRDRVGTLRIGN